VKRFTQLNVRGTVLLFLIVTGFPGTSFSETILEDPMMVLDTIDMQFQFGEYEDAIRTARNFLERNDLNPAQQKTAWVLQARSHLGLGREGLARDCFCEVLRLDPKWHPDAVGFRQDEIQVFEESKLECEPVTPDAPPDLLISRKPEIKPATDTRTAKTAVMRSLVPGMGQHYKGQKTKGIIFQAAIVSAISVAVISNSAMNSAADDYNTSYEQYHAAYSQEEIDAAFKAMQSNYDEMDDKKSLRNLAWMTAGGLWVINLVDAYLGFPLEDAGVELGTMVLPDGQPAIALQLWRSQP